ncbi:MAG: hypothetical protein PUH10_02305 [Erysipelotrichaceae bacterium]|uniref:hypothetical protein n=1 Tax=Floccifex sp. TaxID=2815810 RepID=UPI002A757796|nr:hypothetical protein [Floccifex sp.]MDD7280818.1 hypothetical protein [Erysipelotrichaceae bacterium]MDY2957962.1 hypothetical protein [Floccifex sp.]
MAKQMKKVKQPHKIKNNTIKEKKPKQGHKLVWFTIIIIAIPCVIVGYVLLTSLGGQNKPVIGDRFDKNDLNPEITDKLVKEIDAQLQAIDGVEGVETNLKSATLRISLDIRDDASSDTATAICENAYSIVDSVCPISTYFTNTEQGKMYDLEIGAYTYLVDDAHPLEGQVHIQLTKTGAGEKVIDNMNAAKNQDLVNQIKRY